MESVERYSEGKIHKSEPDPRNGNVNTTGTYFYSSGEIFDKRAHQMLVYIPNSCLYCASNARKLTLIVDIFNVEMDEKSCV